MISRSPNTAYGRGSPVVLAGWTGDLLVAGDSITSNAATDKLVSFVDFGGTVSSTASNYNVTFSTPLYINR